MMPAGGLSRLAATSARLELHRNETATMKTVETYRWRYTERGHHHVSLKLGRHQGWESRRSADPGLADPVPGAGVGCWPHRAGQRRQRTHPGGRGLI